MPAVYTALLPVFGAIFILIAGNGIITTLVPLRGTLEGFTRAEIGFVGSAYFLGMLAGTWLTPGIVRRAGHTRAFAAFAAVAATATLFMPMMVSPIVWPVLRGIIGMSFAGMYGVVEGWINVRASNANRGRLLAVYNVVQFTGNTLGQQMLRVFNPRSFELFSATAMCMVLSLLPMAMTRADPPPLPPAGRLEIRSMLAIAPIGAVGALLVGFANGSLWAHVPASIEHLGRGQGTVANFMTAVILGSALGPYPVGRLSDRLDRRFVIAGAALAAALVEAVMVLAFPPPDWLLIGLGFWLGVTVTVLYPLLTAHVVDRMGTEKAVAISATLLFLYCVGAIIGPLTAGGLMTHFGDPMLFVQNGVLHVVICIYVLARWWADRGRTGQAPDA